MASHQPRILLVDDEPQIRAFLCDLLGETHDVLAVDGGQAALDAIEAASNGEGDGPPFELVISDIRMPGMTGLELIERLGQRAEPIDVIVMTGNADVDTAISALKHGAYDYVRKPFGIDEILHAIDRVTQRQALEREAARYRDHLEQLVEQRTTQYRRAILGALDGMVRALEARDPYTRNHSDNVARLAAALARAAGHGDDVVERVVTAGLLHDIGKIGVRDEVLHKPGPLSDAEYAEVKTHPGLGAQILQAVVDDADVLSGVRHHHEAWGGGGYPEGLAGGDIPLFARLLAIADVYDAMTSDRSYRAALSPETARAQVREGAGRQFDPALVEPFLALDLEAIRARGPINPLEFFGSLPVGD